MSGGKVKSCIQPKVEEKRYTFPKKERIGNRLPSTIFSGATSMLNFGGGLYYLLSLLGE